MFYFYVFTFKYSICLNAISFSAAAKSVHDSMTICYLLQINTHRIEPFMNHRLYDFNPKLH